MILGFRKPHIFFLLLLSLSLKIYGGDIPKRKNYSFYIGLKQNTGGESVNISPNLGIYYLHRKTWSLGFGLGYFTAKIDQTPFKVLELSKEVLYDLRVFHPLYIQFGPSFSYLRPLEVNGRFNLAHHEKYKTNISLAGNIHLLIRPHPQSLLFKMSISPWFSFFDERLKGVFFLTSIGYRF